MKGLLLKDMLLLKNNKKLYAILVFFAVIYPMMGMGSFTITFLGMMGLIISISTMNYDEFDNGNSFLFSLAFKRSTYVAEKYVLCIGGGILGALLGTLVCFVMSKVTGNPALLEGMAENLCRSALQSFFFRYAADFHSVRRGKRQAGVLPYPCGLFPSGLRSNEFSAGCRKRRDRQRTGTYSDCRDPDRAGTLCSACGFCVCLPVFAVHP